MATRTDTHHMADQVVKSAHEALDGMSGSASHVAERLRETTHTVQESIKAGAQKAQDTTKGLTKSVTGYIQENPLATVGIAATVGVVMGMLLRRW